MKLIFNTHIQLVEERHKTVRAWKKPSGDVKTEIEGRGWWIVLDGMNVAVYAGRERPNFIQGQLVQLTIEPRSAG